MKLFAVIGTRPEAIKMLPLVSELKKRSGVECIVCLTGQHGLLLKNAIDGGALHADYDLELLNGRPTLDGVVRLTLERLTPVLRRETPDAVLVHGDTSSSFAAALSAFYLHIPIIHIEAGLRTGDLYDPFPEESNRVLISRLAALNFAPDSFAAAALESERVPGRIFTVGNTISDSLAKNISQSRAFASPELQRILPCERYAVVTAHRRENLGAPLERVCRSVTALADEFPDMKFIFPVHPNPAVHNTVMRFLSGRSNIFPIHPLGVRDMNDLTRGASVILTDSGGLSEEAALMDVPCIVLREKTERTAFLRQGKLTLAGTSEERITAAFRKAVALPRRVSALPPESSVSERIADIILSEFNA